MSSQLSTATIANGGTNSTVIDLEDRALLGFSVDGWTANTCTIHASADGTTYRTVINDSLGSQANYKAALTAAVFYAVDPVAFLGFRYVKFISGGAQGAARTFTVQSRRIA